MYVNMYMFQLNLAMRSAKTTMPLTRARAQLFRIAEDVQTPGRHYTLTSKGVPSVVVISADEFDSWMETVEVLQEMPDLPQRIKEAEEEYKRGEYVTLEELEKEFGYPPPSHVSTRRPARGKKRARKNS